MKIVYALLAVLGTIIPLAQLFGWLVNHGLDVALFFEQAFGPNVAAFAWFDVVLSAIALLFFIYWEGRRMRMTRLWLPALGTCVVGVSLGLPLFLLMRENARKGSYVLCALL